MCFRTLRVSKHKARMTYKCWNCGKPIAVGKVYTSIVGIGEGDFCYFKECEQCSESIYGEKRKDK